MTETNRDEEEAAHAETGQDPLDGVAVAQVEDEQILDVRRRGRDVARGGELQVRTGPRDVEHDALVAGMVLEAGDLRQPEPVPVEGYDLAQPAALPGHPQLHLPNVAA